MKVTEKFIAFVDIVGFTSMVAAGEASGGDLTRALELASAPGSSADAEKVRRNGHFVCPQAPYIEKGARFEVTQVSDCVVASAEVSSAGSLTVVHHCHTAAVKVASKGGLCRGVITKGNIVHAAGQFALVIWKRTTPKNLSLSERPISRRVEPHSSNSTHLWWAMPMNRRTAAFE